MYPWESVVAWLASTEIFSTSAAGRENANRKHSLRCIIILQQSGQVCACLLCIGVLKLETGGKKMNLDRYFESPHCSPVPPTQAKMPPISALSVHPSEIKSHYNPYPEELNASDGSQSHLDCTANPLARWWCGCLVLWPFPAPHK